MKLYKALKLKNKLVGEINKLQQNIQHKNSFVVDSLQNYNVLEMIQTLESKKTKLINLKLAINEANQDIQKEIYLLSEIKSTINFYQSLNTSKGKQYSDYSRETVLEYTCWVDELEKDNKIKELEDTLESIQELIDSHNYTKEIEVTN